MTATSGTFEDDVMAALARGNRDEALTMLMRELGTAVYRYCRRLLGDAAIADDVQQTVFVEAYEHLESFERRSSLRSWLFAIAHHRCLDALKARQRFASRFTLGEAPTEQRATDSLADEQLESRGVGAALGSCLDCLEPHVRMAVTLRYQEGFSYDDMARISRERAGTLQARVARAMPALRRCLECKGVR